MIYLTLLFLIGAGLLAGAFKLVSGLDEKSDLPAQPATGAQLPESQQASLATQSEAFRQTQQAATNQQAAMTMQAELTQSAFSSQATAQSATQTFEFVVAESLKTAVAASQHLAATAKVAATQTAANAKEPPTTASEGDTWRSPVDGMLLAYIPAGEFKMGGYEEDDEGPIHTVYLDAFWMDTTEVTNAQYALCVADGECNPPEYNSSHTRSDYYDDPKFGDYPVIYVSWEDANKYCAWAERKLPTEAQWEKAARGGLEGKDYPWGNQEPTSMLSEPNGSNFGDWHGGDTMQVKSFTPNGYGLYDMAGNVEEWIFDWYSSRYYFVSPAENPTGRGFGSSRVIRGGSWYRDSKFLRAASRGWCYWYSSGCERDSIGFRCAR